MHCDVWDKAEKTAKFGDYTLHNRNLATEEKPHSSVANYTSIDPLCVIYSPFSSRGPVSSSSISLALSFAPTELGGEFLWRRTTL